MLVNKENILTSICQQNQLMCPLPTGVYKKKIQYHYLNGLGRDRGNTKDAKAVSCLHSSSVQRLRMCLITNQCSTQIS